MKRLTVILLIVVQAALWILLTEPVIFFLDEYMWNGAGDHYQFCWNLWWFKKAVTSSEHQLFYTDYLFYPHGTYLTFHTFSYVNCLVGWPMQYFWDVGTVYSVLMLMSFLLSGIAAFLLIYDYTGHFMAATAGSVIFAYNPAHYAHSYGHLNIVSIEWIPMYLLFLGRLLRLSPERLTSEPGRESNTRPIPLAIAVGFFFAVTTLSCWYYMVYLIIFSIVFFLFAKNKREIWRYLIVAAASALVFMLPVLIPLILAIMEGGLPIHEGGDVIFSLDLAAFLVPSVWNHFTGWLFPIFQNAFPTSGQNTCEGLGYFGVVPIIIGLWALFRLKGARLWKVTLILSYIFALGPKLQILGGTIEGLPMPYSLLKQIPILNFARVPSRFVMITYLALGMLVAMSWQHFSEKWTGKWRRGLLGLAMFGILLEYNAIPILMGRNTIPEVYHYLANVPGDFAVFESPPTYPQHPKMYAQTLHEKKIMTGIVSRHFQETDEKSGFLFETIVMQHRIAKNDIVNRTQSNIQLARYLGLRYVVLNLRKAADNGWSRNKVIPLVREIYDAEPVFEDINFALIPIKETEPKMTVLLATNSGELNSVDGKPCRSIQDSGRFIILNPFKAKMARIVVGFEKLEGKSLFLHVNDCEQRWEPEQLTDMPVTIECRLEQGFNKLDIYGEQLVVCISVLGLEDYL